MKSMNEKSLINYIDDFLSWELDSYQEEINIRGLAADLADRLELDNYCSNPYVEFDRALCCPINKRREKYCGNTLCSSYEFCVLLRKEGYV